VGREVSGIGGWGTVVSEVPPYSAGPASGLKAQQGAWILWKVSLLGGEEFRVGVVFFFGEHGVWRFDLPSLAGAGRGGLHLIVFFKVPSPCSEGWGTRGQIVFEIFFMEVENQCPQDTPLFF